MLSTIASLSLNRRRRNRRHQTHHTKNKAREPDARVPVLLIFAITPQLRNLLSGRGVEDQGSIAPDLAEVEHLADGAGDAVKRPSTDSLPI